MAPNWLPVCAAMQKYCEPYFTAIERWRNYSDNSLLINRIHLVEIANQILSDYSQCEDTYEFDIYTEGSVDGKDVVLLSEVVPTPGKDYVTSGDITAYNASKKIVPARIFNRVGLFFQSNLLKAVAGYSDNYLLKSNHTTRKSVIQAIEKLFRLPENAGKGHFVYRLLNTTDEDQQTLKPFPLMAMSEQTKGFVDILIASKDAIPSVLHSNQGNGHGYHSDDHNAADRAGASGKTKKSGSSSNPWTEKHNSVGTSVAAYFQQGKGKKLFVGRVEKYCPPSKPGLKDQLFHIKWEDGDEQDYDDQDLKKGIALYEKERGGKAASSTTGTTAAAAATTPSSKTPTKAKEAVIMKLPDWIKDDDSIGTKVAQAFKVGGNKKVFQGEVIEFRPPSASKAKDMKYKVKFEDGEILEYDHKQLSEGSKMFVKHFQAEDEEFDDEASEIDGENGEDIEWVKDHPSVGIDVAAFFPGPHRKRKIFRGIVEKFAAESAPGEKDELYHIKWEDGDEADYDEKELEEGIKLFKEHFGESHKGSSRKSVGSSSSSSTTTSTSRKEVVEIIEDKEFKRNPLINDQNTVSPSTVDLTLDEKALEEVTNISSGVTTSMDVEDAEYEVRIETKSAVQDSTNNILEELANDIVNDPFPDVVLQEEGSMNVEEDHHRNGSDFFQAEEEEEKHEDVAGQDQSTEQDHAQGTDV